MKELWRSKYRPRTIDEYVFRDKFDQRKIKKWIDENYIPNLLLSGHAGTGKSSLAKILIDTLEVDPLDVLTIDASKNNSVDCVREEIDPFVQTIPFGAIKIVLLEEADALSPSAQNALRVMMEDDSDSVRFILTCNYPNKIIYPLHSRCEQMHMNSLDTVEFTARLAEILISEQIQFDLDDLDTIVKAHYPDLRKSINTIQEKSIDGTLSLPTRSDAVELDYKIEMVELFKQRKISEARKLICSQARPEEIEDIFKWLYRNINLFGDTDEQQDNAIMIIKQSLVDHVCVADPEINLADCMIRLARNTR